MTTQQLDLSAVTATPMAPKHDGDTTKGVSSKKNTNKKSNKKNDQESDKESSNMKSNKKSGKKKNPASQKYNRGEKNETKGIRSVALKTKLTRTENEAKESEEKAYKAEILLPSQAGYLEAEDMEQTWRFSQAGLKQHVDTRTAEKMFDLTLDQFGPYVMDFTRNGRHVALGGRKGHVATLEWTKFGLTHEMHLRETLRDVKFLHDETMIAVAQKKHVYIYDKDGVELHCLRNLSDSNCLEFLPYHFLLASVGKTGALHYIDTSTGKNVAEHKTRLGEVRVMRQNPRNAVLHLGHGNGTVTLWAPNTGIPLVKMLCHKAPVLSLALDVGGDMMVTSGLDGQVKVWDVRTYKELHSYFTVKPASTIDISDMGQLALGYGSHVAVWKDALRTKARAPYMREEFSGKTVRRVRFCPYEDVLAVSHSHGFTSLVIPGVGEPNFDTFEANPFQTLKQRREKTVVSLLEKLQADMITLDENVFGMMDQKSKTLYDSDRKAMRDIKEQEAATPKDKNRMRGKNRSSKRVLRKRKNIIDQQHVERVAKIAKIHAKRKQDKQEKTRKATGLPKSALNRFGDGSAPASS